MYMISENKKIYSGDESEFEKFSKDFCGYGKISIVDKIPDGYSEWNIHHIDDRSSLQKLAEDGDYLDLIYPYQFVQSEIHDYLSTSQYSSYILDQGNILRHTTTGNIYIDETLIQTFVSVNDVTDNVEKLKLINVGNHEIYVIRATLYLKTGILYLEWNTNPKLTSINISYEYEHGVEVIR